MATPHSSFPESRPRSLYVLLFVLVSGAKARWSLTSIDVARLSEVICALATTEHGERSDGADYLAYVPIVSAARCQTRWYSCRCLRMGRVRWQYWEATTAGDDRDWVGCVGVWTEGREGVPEDIEVDAQG
ncbi:hypothetical protein HD554DRAFT_2117198 [Boletus coccyginus]|nr:hypothetical protein HD554DRAFT_2117198 [Boletus coccyginus]